MKRNQVIKLFSGLISILVFVLLFPIYVNAEDLASDEIQIVEYRDCSDSNAGWTTSETSSKIDVDGTQNCYLKRASYSMTTLYDKVGFGTDLNHAFRLSANLTSPALQRLDIAKKILVEDSTVKCKVNSSLFSDNGIRAGIGAIISDATKDNKVSADEYYYASLAMSQFIYKYTGDSNYKVSDVSNAIFTKYLELAETEYEKVNTKVSAKIDGRNITDIEMVYAGDASGKNYIWKSSDYIVFKDARFLSTIAKGGTSTDFFQFELKNMTTGLDYSDYVYAALIDVDGLDDNDLAYQFGICDSKSFQINDYSNCKALNGKSLPAGDYELSITVNDVINYNTVKTVYSCASTTNTSTKYTPVALANNNVSTLKREINYDLYGSFTILGDTDSTTEEDFGSIHIMSIDESSKEVLSDSEFKICTTSSCTKIIATSKNGKISISPVPVGEYYIVVTKVPSGYITPESEKIKITKNNSYEEDIILSKTGSTGSITVKAVDSKNNVLSGAKVKICKTEDCKDGALYSGNGTYSGKDIPYGTYYLVIDVPKDYVTQSAIKFTLDSKNSTYSKDVKIEAKTAVPDTLSNVSKIFIICGIVGIIAGIYLVYTNAKKQEQV